MFLGTPQERAEAVAPLCRDRNEFDRRMRPIIRTYYTVHGGEAANRLRKELRAVFHRVKAAE